MRDPSREFEKYNDIQEEQNEQACQEIALKNGFTQEQARNCEDGELNCKSCPFNIIF